MTVDELAIELGVSTHYIEHHFPRIKQSWEKRGIKLIKNGKDVRDFVPKQILDIINRD